jgi:mannose-6-phosphate isomerase-like protein (cupin superfamily)
MRVGRRGGPARRPGAAGRGTIFRVVDFPPDRDVVGKLDRGKAFAAMAADHAMDRSEARHPGMHKTSTVDYALVLDGEIWALMDEGETLLKAGDCLVQRGTNHAWSNRTDRPCRVAFILVSSEPRAVSFDAVAD